MVNRRVGSDAASLIHAAHSAAPSVNGFGADSSRATNRRITRSAPRAFFVNRDPRLADADGIATGGYVAGSVVPGDEWIAASNPDAMASVLDAQALAFAARTLQVFDVPAKLHAFAAKALAENDDIPAGEFAVGAVAEKLCDAISDCLCRRLDTHGTPRVFPLGFNTAGMRTITYDRSRKQRIGIHLDAWDGASFGARMTARMRVAVNLGPGRRWFLYAPVCLRGIADVLGHDMTSDDNFPASAADLLQAGLLKRIVAVRLRPGEGYIAPTDALFHDATTMWASRPNFNFQMLVNLSDYPP